jgi:hypothetical protein
MAEKYYGVNSYSYCDLNPIMRIDITGEDTYLFDKKTGAFRLLQQIEENVDRIVSVSKRGKQRIEIDNIEKGILKDGLNLMNNDYFFEIGSEGKASIEGVEEFLLRFSDIIDRELAGYYYSQKNTDEITNVKIGRYENNTATISIPGAPFTKEFNNIDEIYLRANFHTHLSRFNEHDRLRASGADISFKNRQLTVFNNSQFNNGQTIKFRIITMPYSYYY